MILAAGARGRAVRGSMGREARMFWKVFVKMRVVCGRCGGCGGCPGFAGRGGRKEGWWKGSGLILRPLTPMSKGLGGRRRGSVMAVLLTPVTVLMERMVPFLLSATRRVKGFRAVRPLGTMVSGGRFAARETMGSVV